MEINALEIFNKIYPVGSIYLSVNNSNPSNYFGGTWVAWGSGRVPVGVNTSDSNFNTVEKTGGESEHTLTVDELADHTHAFSGTTSGTQAQAHVQLTYPNILPDNWGNEGKILGGAPGNAWSTEAIATIAGDSHTHTYSGETEGLDRNTVGNQSHNNLQPYITCYMWKRTA